MFWKTNKHEPKDGAWCLVIENENTKTIEMMHYVKSFKSFFTESDYCDEIKLENISLWMNVDDLWKINEVAEEIEGCCFEIQQNLLPKIQKCHERDRIDEEVSAIDKVMTKLRME